MVYHVIIVDGSRTRAGVVVVTRPTRRRSRIISLKGSHTTSLAAKKKELRLVQYHPRNNRNQTLPGCGPITLHNTFQVHLVQPKAAAQPGRKLPCCAPAVSCVFAAWATGVWRDGKTASKKKRAHWCSFTVPAALLLLPRAGHSSIPCTDQPGCCHAPTSVSIRAAAMFLYLRYTG